MKKGLKLWVGRKDGHLAVLGQEDDGVEPDKVWMADEKRVMALLMATMKDGKAYYFDVDKQRWEEI